MSYGIVVPYNCEAHIVVCLKRMFSLKIGNLQISTDDDESVHYASPYKSKCTRPVRLAL